MFGISFAELMIVFLLVLVVMGPEKLPQVARWTGKGLRELRKASNTLRGALEMEDLETGPTRSRPRQLPDRSSSSPTDAPARAPASTDAPDPEPPAEPAPPPTGLDQVDDTDFEKMLQEQYAIRHGGRQQVDLSPRRPSPHRTRVALPPRRTSDLRAMTELPPATRGDRS